MTEVDYRRLAQFRTQLRRFLRKSEDAATAVGLQPQQYQVLLMVKGLEAEDMEATISLIADRLHLRHHSVVGLIDRLERKELVTRQRTGLDQRSVTVALTDEGNKLIERLTLFHQEILRSLGADLAASLWAVMGENADSNPNAEPSR